MMYRPTKALINLPALRENLQRAKDMAPQSKVLAVIKANGYGHGIERVAQQLSGADAFGVASVDEAILLRQKGFLHRVLLLEGLFSEAEIPVVIQNRLDLVIHSEHQLQWLLNARIDIQLSVWIKIDTGMHRLGFHADKVDEVVRQLQASDNEFCIHMMSHFASADEQDSAALAFTQTQMQRFAELTSAYQVPKSLANSAGMVFYPESHYQWIRPGIFLYGAGFSNTPFASKPVMQLESEVIAIKNVTKGESVGYGNTWKAPDDSLIAVVAIGYGDGYPRHAPSGTPVLINGIRCPLVGRVSMDMITVDITKLQNEVHIGDQAVLWGEHLSVDEIAHHAGTIGYELLCAITQRVPMIEVQ